MAKTVPAATLGGASERATVQEGEANRMCETKEMTRSMMATPLGLGEDWSDDFDGGGHDRAQSSWGRRPEAMELAMEDSQVFFGTSGCHRSRSERLTCLNGVESKAAVRGWRRGRCVLALGTGLLWSNSSAGAEMSCRTSILAS